MTGVGPTPTPRPSITKGPTVQPTPYCASDREFDFAYALDGGLTLHWTLFSDRVQAALVTSEGWAAIGWGSDGLMNGAECVIGEPNQLPQKYVLRGYKREDVQQVSTQSLEDASTEVEADGTVVYAFTKLLDEPGEKAVTSVSYTHLRAHET